VNSETLERIKRDMEGNRFSEAALTVIPLHEGYALIAEIERLQRVFIFHAETGTLSEAQAATALNMSLDEFREFKRRTITYQQKPAPEWVEPEKGAGYEAN
jgi:hypothetical protein